MGSRASKVNLRELRCSESMGSRALLEVEVVTLRVAARYPNHPYTLLLDEGFTRRNKGVQHEEMMGHRGMAGGNHGS